MKRLAVVLLVALVLPACGDPAAPPAPEQILAYQATAVPLENRDHVTILSDYHSPPALVADRFAPNCLTSADANAFDVNGYWKWFDGLNAAAFYGRYREYALGNTPQRRFMGTWPDGTPIVEPIVSDSP